jgi:DNA-binding HxlR family transcriptional regulator
MILLDLLGRRWTLRILWELRDGPQTFRSLQQRCGNISPTVLNKRIKELKDADIIKLQSGEGYGLTEQGAYLGVLLLSLNEWARHWAGQVD